MLSRTVLVPLALATGLVAGCAVERIGLGRPDSGRPVAVDAALPDGGVSDGGVPDAALPDGGPFDGGGAPDGGALDGGALDGGALDGGALDGGASDGGPPDAGVDACTPGPELCNGRDDDCDPDTPDGADEPDLGAPCDGEDADACEDGVLRCTPEGLLCDDDPASREERCNGVDDDCDGATDEGEELCGACVPRPLGASVFLFCDETGDWDEARDGCAEHGGDLASLETEAESDLVASVMNELDWREDAWIGMEDATGEDDYAWLSTGEAPSYDRWQGREPTGGSEDCVRFTHGSERWRDAPCDRDRYLRVCESPLPPPR